MCLQIHRRGFFPTGGGHVQLTVPVNGVLRGIQLTRQGTPVSIDVYFYGFGSAVQPPVRAHFKDHLKRSLQDLCPSVPITLHDDITILHPPTKAKHSTIGAQVVFHTE